MKNGGLPTQGIRNLKSAHWNLGTAELLEHAIRRKEGMLSSRGAISVNTGQFTGRSPKDKFVVRDELTETTVNWGAVNQPMSSQNFGRLYAKVLAYLQGRDVFVQDCHGGADPSYSLPVRVITQHAWHALFARQLFIPPDPAAIAQHSPEFTLIFVPGFQADAQEDGTNSETCIALDFTRRTVIIAGTSYAGEMKKSVFTILNYLLPSRNVMPMHCSANQGDSGDVALLFGLSGTG
jgi:phosphoenolpyruvate carboxykinase (ATP)